MHVNIAFSSCIYHGLGMSIEAIHIFTSVSSLVYTGNGLGKDTSMTGCGDEQRQGLLDAALPYAPPRSPHLCRTSFRSRRFADLSIPLPKMRRPLPGSTRIGVLDLIL